MQDQDKQALFNFESEEECHLGDDVNNAVMAVYMENEVDILGFVNSREINEGDVFPNPYNEKTRIKVLEVDYAEDRIYVGLINVSSVR